MSALLVASFQAAVLAGVVLLVERLAGGWLGPRLRYALWGLVLLRLALPVSLADPFGATRPDWWTRPLAELTSAANDADALPSRSSGAAWTSASADSAFDSPGAAASGAREQPTGLREPSPASPTPASLDPAPLAQVSPAQSSQDQATQGGASQDHAAQDRAASSAGATNPRAERKGTAGAGLLSLGLDAPARPAELATARDAQPHRADTTLSSSPPPWAWAWLAGALLLLGRATVGELRFRRRLRREARPADPALRDAATRCAQRLGLARAPEVLIVPGLPSPAAHGLWHGRLLLPADLADRLDADALRFVLLHELTHLRHRDGLANLVVAVLQALHWFNPAAHLAAVRLRAEREVLRDREAAAALPELTARRCAETLLTLLPRRQPAPRQVSLSAILPHRRTLHHRIAMILRTRPVSRFQSAAGLTAFALLAWAGLTQSPRPAESPAGTPAGATTPVGADALDASPHASAAPAAQEPGPAEALIRVTREHHPGADEVALRARLGAEVSWTEALDLDAFAARLEEQTQVPVRMTSTLREDGRTIAPLHVALPADRALDLLSTTAWLRWSVDERGLALESRDESPQRVELRFYDVRPLLQGDPDLADRLIDVVEELTEGNGTWDWDEVGMQYWNGQLLVRQSPRAHDALHALLELIARGSSGPLPPMSDAHRAALRAPADFAAEDLVGDALARRLAEHGIALFGAPEVLEEQFARDFVARPLEEVLQHVASDWGMPVVYDAGVIVVGFEAPLEVRAHAIGDLLDGDPEVRDRLEELVVEMTGEDHWDIEYSGIQFWDEVMLVRQYRGVHLAVERFLETARRAVRQ